MDIKFVIPKDVDPDSSAYEGRPETWRELAKEANAELEIDGSAWCVENDIEGLGFVKTKEAEPVVTSEPSLFDRVAQLEADVMELKRGKG